MMMAGSCATTMSASAAGGKAEGSLLQFACVGLWVATMMSATAAGGMEPQTQRLQAVLGGRSGTAHPVSHNSEQCAGCALASSQAGGEHVRPGCARGGAGGSQGGGSGGPCGAHGAARKDDPAVPGRGAAADGIAGISCAIVFTVPAMLVLRAHLRAQAAPRRCRSALCRCHIAACKVHSELNESFGHVIVRVDIVRHQVHAARCVVPCRLHLRRLGASLCLAMRINCVSHLLQHQLAI